MTPGILNGPLAAVAVAVCLASAVPARADVIDKTPGGFTVKVVVDVAAPPDVVYTSLVRHVGEWWDPAHTYSGDSKNLSIVAEPGGCFCEVLPAGGVQHATIVNVAPGRLLRMTGSIGPLQPTGTSGALSWEMAKSGTGSKLTMTYSVGGYAPGGLDALAPAVDMVLTRQVRLLAAFAEKSARIP